MHKMDLLPRPFHRPREKPDPWPSLHRVVSLLVGVAAICFVGDAVFFASERACERVIVHGSLPVGRCGELLASFPCSRTSYNASQGTAIGLGDVTTTAALCLIQGPACSDAFGAGQDVVCVNSCTGFYLKKICPSVRVGRDLRVRIQRV